MEGHKLEDLERMRMNLMTEKKSETVEKVLEVDQKNLNSANKDYSNPVDKEESKLELRTADFDSSFSSEPESIKMLFKNTSLFRKPKKGTKKEIEVPVSEKVFET